MKRLLLPLLAALALPNAVISGDLGSADFIYKNIPERFKTEKYKKLSQQNSFDWYCGGNVLIVDGNPRRPKRTPCKITFKDGRLIVDNGIGILPSQVVDWFTGWGHSQSSKDLLIYYRNSENKITPALFAPTGSREAFSFYMRFLNWMSDGK